VKHYIGIDPDLTTTAWAHLDSEGRLVDAGTVRVDSHGSGKESVTALDMSRELHRSYLNRMKEGDFVIAVEGQDLYIGKTPNPKDILALSFVAGACAAYACQHADSRTVLSPKPVEWKGSKDKLVHQRQICRRMNWGYSEAGGKNGYCIPILTPKERASFTGLSKPSDWKHAMDAVGLALYAMDIDKYGSVRVAKVMR
jgi:hypothetical protein